MVHVPKLLKRAGLAWLALQICWQGAAAQDASPERTPQPAAPPAAPAVEAVRPVVPAPQMPADPLGGKRPAVDASPPASPPPTTVAPPAAVPSPPPRPDTIVPPPSLTRSIPGPTMSVPTRPAGAIDAQGNAVGQDLDAVRRSAGGAVSSSGNSGAGGGNSGNAPGATASASPGFRALKRLTPPEILGAASEGFAIYVLRDSERTLILDFPNTREQSRMFARLILFIERGGASKTRVMTVPEVQKWLKDNAQQFDTLTVGNNMKTGEIARFFNSARFQGEPITVDEQRLYDWLVQAQLLREEDSGVSVVEPERILVSLPQASSVPGCGGCTVSAAQRAIILQHELSHARFATDTVYQNYSLWFWSNALSLVQRDKFTRFLRSRGYDTSIRELCANEMQAFLMHTPDPQMFSASDIGVSDADLADMRRKFTDGIAPKPRAAADRPYQFD